MGSAIARVRLGRFFHGDGALVATFGFSIGFDPSMLRFAIAALMVAVGIVLLVPSLQGWLASQAASVTAGGQTLIDRIQPAGTFGPLALGAMLGVVWSPCAGPTLGVAVGLAAQSETIGKAALLMGIFSLGAVTPILLLAYGSRRAIAARRELLAGITRIAKPVTAGALIVLGAFVLTGMDKRLETLLTDAMPAWLVGLTTSL
ncbi:MAG: cytochrome c biogenesis CcdA family protein [Variibacter sp.]